MPSRDYKSPNVLVTIEQEGSGLGPIELVIILLLATPWFAPTIGLSYYVSEILNWHSVAVTIIAITTLILNYALLLVFVKKLPKLFVLLGSAEFAAVAYGITELNSNFDVYWQIFLSFVAAAIGGAVFAGLVMKVNSPRKRQSL